MTFYKSWVRCSLSEFGRFIHAFVFPILILFPGGCKKQSATPSVPEVQVVTVVPANVPIFEEWIGTLDGFVNAQIHAQVTGYLLTQNYAEGNELKKGDLLFQIDPYDEPPESKIGDTFAFRAQACYTGRQV